MSVILLFKILNQNETTQVIHDSNARNETRKTLNCTVFRESQAISMTNNNNKTK